MHSKRSIFWIIALTLITILIFYFGREEIVGLLIKANLATMGGLFLLQVFTLGLTAFQWHFMLKKAGATCSPGMAFAVTMAGNYVESVTPAAKLGGESARIYLFHQRTGLSYERLAGILLALKYFSLLPFVALVAISLGLAFWRYELPLFVPGAFVLLALFFLATWWLHKKGGPGTDPAGAGSLIKNDRPGRETGPDQNVILEKSAGKICKKYRAIVAFTAKASADSRYLVNFRERIALIFISALIWSLYPLKVYIVCHMLFIDADFLTVAMVTYTAYMISMVPLLPGGLGSFEGSMALLFSMGGLSPASGLTIALLTRLATYWFPLLLSALASLYVAAGLNSAPPPAKGAFSGSEERKPGLQG